MLGVKHYGKDWERTSDRFGMNGKNATDEWRRSTISTDMLEDNDGHLVLDYFHHNNCMCGNERFTDALLQIIKMWGYLLCFWISPLGTSSPWIRIHNYGLAWGCSLLLRVMDDWSTSSVEGGLPRLKWYRHQFIIQNGVVWGISILTRRLNVCDTSLEQAFVGGN